MKKTTKAQNDRARAALCEVDQLLPLIHESDGGRDGKGHDLQFTCYHCRNCRRCLALGCTKRTNTHCDWSPSRFKARKDVE